MAKTIIEELVTRLGFDIDDKKLDSFNKKSERLKNVLKKAAIWTAGAATALTAWVSKVAIATDANIKFADSIAISFQSLQELQFAIEREGGTLSGLQSSLFSLSQRASEAFRGIGAGVEIFGLLGVSVRDANGQLKTADILLDDIAGQFTKFGKIQQVEFANKLGISQDTLLLLQKGDKNLRDLRKTARDYGLVTEETARNSERFQDSISDIRFVVRALFTNIAGQLMPMMSDLADRFREWFLLNKELIKQNIGKLFKVLVKSVELLVKHSKILLALLAAIFALKIAAAIGGFVLAIGPMIAGIVTLNANLVITNVLMAGIPVLIGLIVAGFAALILIVQDIMVFERGGESFFGKIIKAVELGNSKFAILLGHFRAIQLVLNGITDTVSILIFAFEKLGILTDKFLEKAPRGLEFGPGFRDELDVGDDLFNSSGLQSRDINITAPITVTSETGDPVEIANAVSQAISNLARQGINSNPQVIRV